MKRKKNGTDLSDIGTTQLHIKHDVQVEKLESGLARAKVRDQLVIDAYLFEDKIVNFEEFYLLTVSQCIEQ